MENVNLRLLVLEMLMEVTENRNGGTYSHIAVRDVLKKYNYLSQQEKSFLKRLFEGTLERMITLDFVINQYSKVKTDKMKPQIRAILRLSVYQILYMDAVPDAAACNEAVKLAQKKGFATLKGFVNGVLRNIAKNKDTTDQNDIIITNLRQAEALGQAIESIRPLINGLNNGLESFLIAEHLRETISHLSTITGTIPSTEILNTIFSQFCIGK